MKSPEVLVPAVQTLSRRDFLKVSPLIVPAILAACDSPEEQSVTTRVDNNMVIESVEGKFSIELITSSKYYFDQKQKEVTKNLDELVNSGARNIREVQTSYSDGYLLAARINHVNGTQGKGNEIRLKLIQSSAYYWDKKDKETKRMLDEALKDLKSVHKVNTIFGNGYLLAAEIWYFKQ